MVKAVSVRRPALSRRPRRRAPRLVALGDLLLDVVVAPDGPLERGSDVRGSVTFRRGGSAANTAAAFARAGGAATLITVLGEDAWSKRLVASLRADGVRVRPVRRRGPSGRLAVIVDDHGDRSFVTQRGVADDLRQADVDGAWLRDAEVIHVPAYSLLAEPIGAAAVSGASRARDAGALVSSDLSSAGPLRSFGIRASKDRIAEIAPDILFANRDEAAAILRQPGRRAWPGLLELAPLVVVKDGIAGCRVLWREVDASSVLQLEVAATRIPGADPTGAGDAFAAGFLFSLLRSGGAEALLRAPALRRAALAGHRAAADALRRGRPEIRLG